jgi:hypothetical protein
MIERRRASASVDQSLSQPLTLVERSAMVAASVILSRTYCNDFEFNPGKSTEILGLINQELNNFIQGPGPFYIYANEPPKLVQDIHNGEPRGEFLESAIWEDMPYTFTRTEFWRVRHRDGAV